MSVTSLICTYLYGSLAIIRATIETSIKMSKNLLEGLNKVAQAAITVCRYTIDVAINTTVKLVKQYEKELFDMLYESLFGEKKTVWCHRLWKCLALINELLDPESFLFRKLSEYWDNQCKTNAMNNLLENIRDIISDFSQFQKIVCSAGFTVTFGISYIKNLLGWCKEQMEGYLSWIERKKKELMLLAEEYLNTLFDWGVIDYIEKLCSFFTCVFDGKDSCAEIATAENFYKDAMSKLKLQKEGDGYNLSTEYRNSLYGSLEGSANRLANLTQEIDRASKMCIDPERLENANNAYNLAEHLLPKNDDGSYSWSKLSRGDFKSTKIYQYVNLKWEDLNEAIDRYKENGEEISDETIFPTDLTPEQLAANTKIDENGVTWYRAGCTWIKLADIETKEVEEFCDTDISTDVMLDGEYIVTLGQAAMMIRDDPESDFSKECITLHNFVMSWQVNADAAARYNDAIL